MGNDSPSHTGGAMKCRLLTAVAFVCVVVLGTPVRADNPPQSVVPGQVFPFVQ